MKRFVSTLLILSISALTLLTPRAPAQSKPEASPDDYKVYEAVLDLLDRVPKMDPHITISDVTLNSKCGEDAYPSPLANGCTFLWIAPDTPADVKELLRQDWADLDDSTWTNFVANNAVSARLREPIATRLQHKLVGDSDPLSQDSASPDLAIFLSRVGFNQNKTEAIVYVLIFSNMANVSTAGDYFLFRLDKQEHWKAQGRVTYAKTGKDQPP